MPIKSPEKEVKKRISKLKKKMMLNDIESILLTHEPDIFYFSGIEQPGFLYVHIEHQPILLADDPFLIAKSEDLFLDVIQISSVAKIPEKIKTMHSYLPGNLGLAFDVVPVADYKLYQELFNQTIFTDCSKMLIECKAIKSEWEINRIKEATRLSEKTFSYICEHIRPGISEIEFCGEFEAYAATLGHSGALKKRHYRCDIYPFHLLSGESGGVAGSVDTPCCGTGTSAAHPSGAGPKKINKNEPILIDFATVLNGYHSDETRMFAIGAMPQKAMNASKAAIEILHFILPEMKPGIQMQNIFEKSILLAQKLGLADEFLGLPELKSTFIGHGIGVVLVEAPFIAKKKDDRLKENMVFSIEPKFIFKNEFAAGIESVVQITPKGGILLSTTPHQVFIV